MNFDSFARHGRPFPHWIADRFLDAGAVAEINTAWPADMEIETGVAAAMKGAKLFPRRLPDPAQRLAEDLMAPAARARLSELVGVDLLPDPWLTDGPLEPKLGGGLHEIHRGGLLRVHVDFEAHPSGLRRVANLLVYLTPNWQPAWGGALELHERRDGGRIVAIPPNGGRAVLFLTTPDSWHGHPMPLDCPPGVTRRSLALYYYAVDDGTPARPKTVYGSKR